MDELTGWSEFAVAMAGASAALAGLLIVAMSVNIKEIVTSPSLLARSGAAIGGLVLALVVSCLVLMPGAELWVVGLGVLIACALGWYVVALAIRAVRRDPPRSGTPRVAQLAVTAAPVLAFTVGGMLLMTGLTGGMAVIAVACLLAVVAAILLSWVALVEVLR